MGGGSVVGGQAPEPAVAGLARLREELAELAELPLAEHAVRFEAAHAELTEALAAIDRVMAGAQRATDET